MLDTKERNKIDFNFFPYDSPAQIICIYCWTVFRVCRRSPSLIRSPAIDRNHILFSFSRCSRCPTTTTTGTAHVQTTDKMLATESWLERLEEEGPKTVVAIVDFFQWNFPISKMIWWRKRANSTLVLFFVFVNSSDLLSIWARLPFLCNAQLSQRRILTFYEKPEQAPQQLQRRARMENIWIISIKQWNLHLRKYNGK